MHMNAILLCTKTPLTQCLCHVELGAFLNKFTYIEVLYHTLQKQEKTFKICLKQLGLFWFPMSWLGKATKARVPQESHTLYF